MITMDTHRVKGYALVMLAFIFFIYSIYTKKKSIYFFSSIFIVLGYLYTFFTVIKVYNSTITLKIGFYIYLLSFIIFV